MSLRNPLGRNQRDWGNYASLAACPKAISTAVALNKTDGVLEVGDTAYITGSGPAHCTSAGTAGVKDATWALTGASPVLFTLDTTGTTQLGTPSFFRATGDLPASPTGAVVLSSVASASMAGRSAIRMAGTINGGWAVEVLHGITLPAEGYILDVEIAGIGAWISGVLPLMNTYSPGGQVTPRGIMFGQRLSASNLFSYMLSLATTVYTRPVALTQGFSSSTAAPTAALFQRSSFRYVVEVRRKDAQTPAQWTMRVTVYSDGSMVSSACSQVTNPLLTSLDGLSFDKVGIFVFSDSGVGATAESIDVTKFQIRRLDTGTP